MTTSLPPGPRTPSFVQTLALLRDPLGYLARCGQRYGDAFTLRIGVFAPLVHLASPPLLRQMFTADPEIAWAGEANFALFGPLTGRGTLFTMEGDAHLRRRRLLLPPFHGERLQRHFAAMVDVTERAIESWPRDRPFALHQRMQDITLEIILRVIFGLAPGERPELRELLRRLADLGAGSPLLFLPALQLDLGRWSPWGRVLRLLRETHAALLAEITRRRAHPGGDDVLALLLEARDEAGESLPDEAIRDELALLLLAGHETTSTSLAWAFRTLLAAPEAVARIRAEDAESGGRPTDRPYLDAAIKEAMRLRPIMPTAGARLLKAPMTVGPWTLPAGTWIASSLTVLHRRADLYADPDAFRPERFLGKKTDPYEWAPFGGGVRRCLGMAFALAEMRLVIATVLRRTELRLVAPQVRPGSRGFFIPPADGTRVALG